MDSIEGDSDGCYEIDSIIRSLSDLHRVQRHYAYQETDQGSLEEDIFEADSERAKSAPAQIRNHMMRISEIQDTLGRLKCNLKRLQLDVKTELNTQLRSLSDVVDQANDANRQRETLPVSLIQNELNDITQKLVELMSKVSVLPERRRQNGASPDYDKGGRNQGKDFFYFPSIHSSEADLKRHAFFREVKDKFERLSIDHRFCLLSFAVFPENQEVNGTMLMYWWIGEGILPITEAEDEAKNILQGFLEMNLIEAVTDMRKIRPSTYKMNPFVHSSVVLISKEIGVFDMYRKGQKPTMNKSDLKKVCLVERSSSQPNAKAKTMAPADIETVFNVSENFPDFIFRWFSSMEVLKVLYLGRWERSEREIQVDSHGLMKDLSFMGELRLLSFQGISTIISISPSACKLPKLIILDLRDCYNLEQLPTKIDELRNLVYLDLTGCDALENIPSRLAFLRNLEVIKGFVVADKREVMACQLKDLKHLLKLRKLSVRVDRKDFGLDDLLKSIQDFKVLQKLKVQWGSVNPRSKKLKDKERIFRSVDNLYLPSGLKKLDLRRFPGSKLPGWLQPQNLLHLKQLHLGSSKHIREFSISIPQKPSECSVEVLRLKCLQKLKVNWIELNELYFPNLNFLEIYECPRITLCPCDLDGIWRKPYSI